LESFLSGLAWCSVRILLILSLGILDLRPPRPEKIAPEDGSKDTDKDKEKEDKEGWEALREWLETAVVAVIMALFIRQYLVEPYQIPTGSMGPALHGVHRDIACPECGVLYETGCNDPEDSDRQVQDRALATCPACGTRTELGKHPVKRGDKILANKLLYLMRPPKRWEVVVFRHHARPNDPSGDRTFIKRLAGLPGETLQIRHGDLYINDRIVHRPPEVLEAMRVPVYASGEDRAPGTHWKPDGPETVQEGGGWRFPGASWSRISYPEITDQLAYNAASHGLASVGDLRVTLDCEIPAGAGIGCEIQEDDQLFRWELDGGAGRFTRSIEDNHGDALPTPALPPGLHRLVFTNIDDVQTLEVDGREIGRWTTSTREEEHSSSARLSVLGRSGARIRELRVERDNYYTRPGNYLKGTGTPYRIPEGEYFFLGDNSQISDDSRDWGTVKEADILGRGVLAVVHLDLPWAETFSWQDLSWHVIR